MVVSESTPETRTGLSTPRLNQEQDVVDRVFKTVCLFSCFLTMGLSSPLVGNTLVHLERLFDVSTATMSVTITVQAFGYLFGALICGFVFDRVNHELAFAVTNIIRGISAFVAPFIGGLVPFVAAMGIHNISNGFVDASGQSYCVGLWARHRYRDPLLQATHAMWSLGGTLGPFINARFLADLPQQQQQQQQQTQTASLVENNFTTPSTENLSSADASMETGVANVQYAYVTIGSLILVANCLFIIAYLRGRFKRNKSSSGTIPSPPCSKDFSSQSMAVSCAAEHSSRRPGSCYEDTATVGDFKKLDKVVYLIFIALIFFFSHLYPYSETVPITYITTYAVKYLNFPIQDASLLMSLFFGFHFAGRVLGIPVAGVIRPGKMLTINLSLTAVSFVLLLTFVNVWPTIIWISTPLASLSMSTTFATTILWIGDRVPITGRMSSILLAGYSFGAIVGPLIVGQLFEALDPMWFVYVVVISSLSHLAMFVVISVFDARCGNIVRRQATVDLHGNDDKSVMSVNGFSNKNI